MRGAISLAAALSVPRDVAVRSLLLYLALVVVLATLVLQGTTLPLLLRLTGLSDDDGTAEQEQRARRELARVALARLDELEQQGDLPPGGALPLRQVWLQALARLDEDDDELAARAPAVDLTALRLDLADAQGAALERMRADWPLDPDVARELRQELDLQQVRLDGGRA